MLASVEPLAECLEAALEFRNASRTSVRDAQYIRWRYLERPAASSAFVVWLREGHQALAAATVAPHDFYLHGRRLAIGIVGDISVAAAARGRGLATQLLQAVTNENRSLDGLLVMPNPPLHSTLRAVGWREATGLVRFVRFTSGSGAPGLRRSWERRAARCASALLALGPALRRASYRDEYRLVASSDLPPDTDSLWQSVAGAAPLIASRAPPYLRWRYLNHPLYRYTVLELRRGKALAGYAIARREGDELWVDDWLATDPRATDALGMRLFEWAAGRGEISSVQARSASAPNPWKSNGFVRRADVQAVFIAGPWQSDALAAISCAHFTSGDKDV